MIFNEDKLDEAIEVAQVLESETEDIQLGEDETEIESASSISHQTDHKAKDLDNAVTNKAKKQAEDDDLAWAQGQYPSPDSSPFEAFLANSVGLPVEVTDSFESERVNLSHEFCSAFAATSALSDLTSDQERITMRQQIEFFTTFFGRRPTASATGERLKISRLLYVPVTPLLVITH